MAGRPGKSLAASAGGGGEGEQALGKQWAISGNLIQVPDSATLPPHTPNQEGEPRCGIT